jgi:hypothetical protein
MKRWLLLANVFVTCIATAQVAPLLTTTWNQGCNYNAQCPTTGSGGACGRTWTGCNATAIAQIFKYYSYPDSGMGGSYCNSNAPTHCVDFSQQGYNYSLMPNNVTSANPEVAKLMYHLGIAVDMQWSGSSSNSFFNSTAMKKYFGYSPKMYSTATFMFNTTTELEDAIKAELNAGRPVYAKGGNHFYLIDGYNSSNQFHMNFGWGGTYDGYYSITSVVNAAGTFTPGNFIFMIKPMDGDLEAAADTIEIAAGASTNNALEFTSRSNWTMSTNSSWLTLNLTSGAEGYYAWSSGSYFNATINNGAIRYGHIYLINASDTDTVVVRQLPSPLEIQPDTLYYLAAGGTQQANVSWTTFGTWNAVASAPWITISPNSGTASAVPNITTTTNLSATPRSGYIAFTAGQFRDTLWVEQEGNLTTSINELSRTQIHVFPNPATDQVIIQSASPCRIRILDLSGRIVFEQHTVLSITSIDVHQWASGCYWICDPENSFVPIKLIKQ